MVLFTISIAFFVIAFWLDSIFETDTHIFVAFLNVSGAFSFILGLLAFLLSWFEEVFVISEPLGISPGVMLIVNLAFIYTQIGDINQEPSRPSVGETFTAKIDRISNSGNGIIVVDEHDINIGPVTEDAVGKEITAEMVDKQSARRLTKNAQADDSTQADENVEDRDSENGDYEDTSQLPNVGETFTANVDRISNSGNGIVDIGENHINIGPVTEDAVGEEITAKMVDRQSARCLTASARLNVNEESNQQGDTHASGVQQTLESTRSALVDVDDFLINDEFDKASEYLNNIESELESLEQNHTDPPKREEINELRQSVSAKRQQLQQKEIKEEIQVKIRSINSELYTIDSLITNVEFRQAKRQADKIKADISTLKRQVPQENFDVIKTKLQRLEKECDERLSKSHVLTQLREVDPYEFEKLVAKVWGKQGWDTQVTSGSGDRGVDIIATKEDAFEERRHLIQVKRHGENSRVGSEDIQRYAGLYARRDEVPDAVFVVTSNRFTKDAKEVAENRDVRLVDCDELYEMLTET